MPKRAGSTISEPQERKPLTRRMVVRNLVGASAIVGAALVVRPAPAKAGGGGYGNGGYGDGGYGNGGYGNGDYGDGGSDGKDGKGGKRGYCFLSGTRIRTAEGDVAIESLKIGDLVVTVSGAMKPIRWIGRMSFSRQCESSWSKEVAPIKISRSAIEDGVPHTDVFMSPSHALYFDGALIPCGHLVNGHSITREPMSSETRLDYFHIELATHDVIFAEGLPAETLQGAANRMHFDNYLEYEHLYPGQSLVPLAPCAPVLSLDGGRAELRSRLRSALAPLIDRRQRLDIVRDRLEARAEEWVSG